jgi:hypothetical protein
MKFSALFSAHHLVGARLGVPTNAIFVTSVTVIGIAAMLLGIVVLATGYRSSGPAR